MLVPDFFHEVAVCRCATHDARHPFPSLFVLSVKGILLVRGVVCTKGTGTMSVLGNASGGAGRWLAGGPEP